MKSLSFFLVALLATIQSSAEEQSQPLPPPAHQINFNDVPIIEFIRFVSKISSANFIYDHRDLGFNVTLSSGHALSSPEVVRALVQMLQVHGFGVKEESNCFVIHRLTKKELKEGSSTRSEIPIDKLIAGDIPRVVSGEPIEFDVYKLKYHQGGEIEEALKKIAGDLSSRRNQPHKLIEAIQTLQWVKVTNSLFYSGDVETVIALRKLIQTLDVPLRQVFIEVLVVETDVKKTTEFGLQWIGGGKFKDKVGFGTGNFSGKDGGAFAKTAQGVNGSSPPTGLDQFPLGRGFDLGVIGDIILHKGKSYLTLGSLVSALQHDGDTTIVLNQKIITQDNKNSKIFVGDNIPFTGSIVSTVGNSQQTTANIEYRDIGVNLSITPMLGDDNIITLDIDQEITEAIEDPQTSTSEVEGIRTTKTNMATHVHVPDDHFLVISGMVRNARSYQKAGIPCLGGLPVVGAAFSKTKRIKEKRNVVIFVRPHIVNSFQDYTELTEAQEGYLEVAESAISSEAY